MGKLPTLLLCCLMGLVATSTIAQERIISFQSAIEVLASGEMYITETICVNSTGNAIKRGIYRDFPTLFKMNSLLTIEVPFKVISVSRDNRPEHYVLERLANGQRIRIGNKEQFLSMGEHTYVIAYKTDYQIAFNENQDELFWNVTGNDWDFSIDKASATIRLPSGIESADLKTKAYTGPVFAKSSNASIVVDATQPIVSFETSSRLDKKEGLTVVVGFPKGFVRAPTKAEYSKLYLRANVTLWLVAFSLLVVSAYYFFSWLAVGRDPPGGVVYPLYEPPKKLGPADVRYIRRMGYDKKCFTAAVIELAVKGHLNLEQDNQSEFSLNKNEKPKTPGGLTIAEQALLKDLLGQSKSLTLRNSNHKKINKAITNLASGLEKQFHGTVFRSNIGWLVGGWILSFICILGTALSCGWQAFPIIAFFSFWLSIWTAGCAAMISQALTAWRTCLTLRATTSRRIGHFGSAIVMTLVTIPFLIGEFVAIGFIINATSWLLLPLVLGILLINYLFWWLIKQPTVEGQRLRDEIEGFRMYLGTAEKDYLQQRYAPQKTPELFEQYLPYALALDVENQWAEQFSEVLAAAGQTAGDVASSYQPAWYHGHDWNSFATGAALGALGSALGNAIATSATAPASRGGSSGGGFSSSGGFSGGGGGGGGGGGW